MRGKLRKSAVDEQLLDAIVATKIEWQKIQSIVEKSIDPTEEIIYKQSLAQAKYLFLLRQARYRGLSAIRFN